MKYTYKHTEYSCYLTYIVGGIINNFAPLLLVAFTKDFGLSLKQLSYIIVLNFGTQMVVDFMGIKFIDMIGYRRALILALSCAFVGLVSLGTLPFIMYSYLGVLLAVLFYSTGSGLLEVMVSPTVEALPKEGGSKHRLSMLHSFYCWGSMLVVIGSTIYFRLFSVDNWRYLCFIWSILPLIGVFLFTKVPIVPFKAEDNCEEKGIVVLKSRLFLLFALAMLCSGAGELAMSQWASLFAETGLKVSKTMGDLLGPCFFALMMGVSRTFFGLFGEKMKMTKALIISCLITMSGYLVASLIKNPVVALMGCGLCGLGIGVTWPGITSMAAKYFKNGGTAIFAVLAMCGDMGCTLGPYIVALVSSRFTLYGSDIKAGILFSSVFPIVLILSILRMKPLVKKKKNSIDKNIYV